VLREAKPCSSIVIVLGEARAPGSTLVGGYSAGTKFLLTLPANSPRKKNHYAKSLDRITYLRNRIFWGHMLSISAITILCFIFGSIIGSFLGVCAYRIPMGRYEPVHAGVRELAGPISITNPRRSFCPQCEMQLLWWHNIPLLSWLFLRGRSACYSS